VQAAYDRKKADLKRESAEIKKAVESIDKLSPISGVWLW
jgi:hypothetical protein